MTRQYIEGDFEGKLTVHRCQLVDDIGSADNFYIFSKWDDHYFLKLRTEFAIKASYLIN